MQHFHIPVRVYIEDTDAGGIVYYANYLKYMERARTEWLRAAGIELRQWQQEQHTLFVVRSVYIDYKASACLDDVLHVTVVPEKLKRASIMLEQKIYCGDRLLTHSRVILACVHADTRLPQAIPPFISEAIRVEH